MAKRSATYRQAQLSAAVIRAAQKAGAERVEVDPVSGRIVVIYGGGTTAAPPVNDAAAEWNDVLPGRDKKHGAGEDDA